ncbi:MAG: FHA domain-containing protein [Acidobacteriota bacterium]
MESSPQTQGWYCAEADDQGFVPFEYLQAQARRMTEAQFVAAFPASALMVVYRGLDQAENEGMDPNQSGVQLLTVNVRSAAVLRYLGRVAFVCKRPGNPYAHLISVGRSAGNDITISVDSVSKVHGYLVTEDDALRFTDHGSTNGSRINGHALAPNQKFSLTDGDILQLGLEVMMELLSPVGLYQRCMAD